MSDPNRQRRQCLRKIPYPDLEAAKRAAKAMHKKHKARFDPYSCPFCGGHHVGRRRSQAAGIRRSKKRGQYVEDETEREEE